MTGPPQDLRDFRLAGWLVQPSLGRLTCDGVVVRLRLQLMDMLVYLAERAGRTVTRQELLATIWSGRFVAESGLPRCVAELRQALGDSAREPRIIETIPKRGYRLIAAVVTAPAPIPGVERADASPGSRRSAAEHAGFAAGRYLTAACTTPRPSRFERAISRLRIRATRFGARLWKGRPARPAVRGGAWQVALFGENSVFLHTDFAVKTADE